MSAAGGRSLTTAHHGREERREKGVCRQASGRSKRANTYCDVTLNANGENVGGTWHTPKGIRSRSSAAIFQRLETPRVALRVSSVC